MSTTIIFAFSDLTDLEKQTARQISDGMGNKEIAAGQGCSVKSVENRIRNIFFKLNAKNRAELVSKAIRAGLLSVSLIAVQYHSASTGADDLDFARLQRTGRRGGSRWESPGILSPPQIITA